MNSPAEGGKGPSPFRLLGWVLGGLSILHLMDDMNFVRLRGLVLQWTDAYSVFVETLREALFGWVSFGWVRVDPNEAHLVVVGGVLASALTRAQMNRAAWTSPIERDVSGVLSAVLILSMLVLGPALLLPGEWGLQIALVGTMMLLMLCFWPKTAKDGLPSPLVVFRELAGVLAVFTILVAANYLVQPSSGTAQ